MAVKIVEDSAVLTLDFWDKEVIYNGQVFPVGTLACDALNIPGEVVSHMEKLCEKLNGFRMRPVNAHEKRRPSVTYRWASLLM